MKKILCLLLTVIILVSLVSCGGTTSNPEVSSTVGSGTSSIDNTNDTNDTNDTSDTNDTNDTNEKVNLLDCLKTLLSNYKWSPESKIPKKLHPEYQGNLINLNSVDNDYSKFVSVSNIPQNGIGEQWNMVVENILQSETFFNVLSTVDSLTTVSVTAFNNYIDQNPAEIAKYQFESGIYTVTIHCTQETIEYVLDYISTLPSLGEQSVQIALSMDVKTQTKNVRVQIGDANAMRYTIEENKYTFAIKYLGVRRAYFELLENSDNTVTGHIYEYWTVPSEDVLGKNVEVASVADFYIDDNYLTVVGNKASGLIGFDGVICELYSVSTGKMIAYEVKETLDVLGVGVTYNTLWFDLEDINGITSIKHIPAESLSEKDKIYVNGFSSVWETANYGISGGKKAASRRFDIEFRTQYFYYYDSTNDSYEKIELKVPMLFVQEEVFDDLSKDVKDKNGVDISVDVSAANLTKLKNEYSSKADLIKENKDKYSVDVIIEYIGNKKIFA